MVNCVVGCVPASVLVEEIRVVGHEGGEGIGSGGEEQNVVERYSPNNDIRRTTRIVASVDSLLGGVAPNRRNQGARGLLISACVSLRHMARIRSDICVFYDARASARAYGRSSFQYTWDS